MSGHGSKVDLEARLEISSLHASGANRVADHESRNIEEYADRLREVLVYSVRCSLVGVKDTMRMKGFGVLDYSYRNSTVRYLLVFTCLQSFFVLKFVEQSIIFGD